MDLRPSSIKPVTPLLLFYPFVFVTVFHLNLFVCTDVPKGVAFSQRCFIFIYRQIGELLCNLFVLLIFQFVFLDKYKDFSS